MPSVIDTDRAKPLIAACRRIAAIFDELLPDTALGAAAYREGGVNPFHHRTESGLYLEFYYGYPSRIWTPGGEWSMTGSTFTPAGVEKKNLVQPFMNRLTARLHQPFIQTRWGAVGPVYAVLAVDDEVLEPPGEVTERAVLFGLNGDGAELEADQAVWAPLRQGWR